MTWPWQPVVLAPQTRGSTSLQLTLEAWRAEGESKGQTHLQLRSEPHGQRQSSEVQTSSHQKVNQNYGV